SPRHFLREPHWRQHWSGVKRVAATTVATTQTWTPPCRSTWSGHQPKASPGKRSHRCLKTSVPSSVKSVPTASSSNKPPNLVDGPLLTQAIGQVPFCCQFQKQAHVSTRHFRQGRVGAVSLSIGFVGLPNVGK